MGHTMCSGYGPSVLLYGCPLLSHMWSVCNSAFQITVVVIFTFFQMQSRVKVALMPLMASGAQPLGNDNFLQCHAGARASVSDARHVTNLEAPAAHFLTLKGGANTPEFTKMLCDIVELEDG